MKKAILPAGLLLGSLVSQGAWAQTSDYHLQEFYGTAAGDKVTYSVQVCDGGDGTGAPNLNFYLDLTSPPSDSTAADKSLPSVAPNCGGSDPEEEITGVTASITQVPVGLYQSWARVNTNDTSESNKANNNAGPRTVCVGPDLRLERCEVEANGALVTYKIKVCNLGSAAAEKFRVGIWHDSDTDPSPGDMGHIFHPVTILGPPERSTEAPFEILAESCEEEDVTGDRMANGDYVAYCRVDSGDFVVECREEHDPANGVVKMGKVPHTLANPDLVVTNLEAEINGSTVNYLARVCNEGAGPPVSRFYVDVYYHRPKYPPAREEPGDVAYKIESLAPGDCTDVPFTRTNAPEGEYRSFVQADPDDFIIEPDEANNLSDALTVVIGEGGDPGPVTGPCDDLDGDGYGQGSGCEGVPDCDDTDPDVHFGQEEVCGDNLDQDCDLTPDDGCPGVDCNDSDGDGFGVGADCVLADCDDDNAAVYPWAKETCGDNTDDNCNEIADDGCVGRQCTDEDADGFGVGDSCPGPEDCNDKNFFVHPGAQESCGNGRDDDCDFVADDGCSGSTDPDGDGWGVGDTEGKQPDCDETDSTIKPGAPEKCGDGVDNDCDLTVDDGCPGVDCVDNDGDGWGVGSDCVVPDPNDEDGSIHPWAEEVCDDGVDNDGDGTVDDGCPGVDCVDNDGDSWGVGQDCERSDCNDEDGGTSPWQVEICDDGLDNNCDGRIDEGCLICEDLDADGHGIGPKCSNWDCDDSNPDVHPGATEYCNGVDNDCDETADDQCLDEGGTNGGCGCGLSGARSSEQQVAPFALLGLLVLALGLIRWRRGS